MAEESPLKLLLPSLRL
uniref:Uncharacterized protein n=1 Tax=Arundo donax TaxID=35708 RepID=A0A0A9F4P5_ARUDO